MFKFRSSNRAQSASNQQEALLAQGNIKPGGPVSDAWGRGAACGVSGGSARAGSAASDAQSNKKMKRARDTGPQAGVARVGVIGVIGHRAKGETAPHRISHHPAMLRFSPP